MSPVSPGRPAVKFVAVLPPPHTGMTAVSAALQLTLGEILEVRPFILQRRSGISDRAWSTRKHVGLLIAMTRALLTSPRAAVYMVLDSGSGAWGSALLALMARIAGVPLVVHHHVFNYFTTPSPAAELFFRLAGPRALHLTLCACMAEQLCERYGHDRTTLVLSNPAFVQVSGNARPRTRLLRLGFLGNATWDKGVGLFMETVRHLSSQGVVLEAQIAGPVKDRTLAAAIATFIAEDPEHRTALGPVYGAAKHAFLDSIDVLLFPSQYVNEAQPLTIYEALALGAPVLATDRGCIPEQLPREWVYPESDFVTNASNQLAKWCGSPANFARASEMATEMWTDAIKCSMQQVETMIGALKTALNPHVRQ